MRSVVCGNRRFSAKRLRKLTAMKLRTMTLCLVVLALAACERKASEQETQALKAALAEAKVSKPIQDFYQASAHQPVWIARGKPGARVDDALELLAAAGQEGLRPTDYGVDGLRKRIESSKGDAAAAMQTELALTNAVMRYASDLAVGRPIAKQIDASWTPTPRKLDFAALVREAIAKDELDELPSRLAPKHAEYARLKTLLEAARAANPPDAARVRQLELNLERWRWLADELGAPHILVNVPAFELQVRENAEDVALQMKVIVGKEANRTPIFSDEMTEIVFSPYWNIPQSIEMKEMVPKIQADPDFLEKNQMEVVRVRDGKAESVSSVKWEELAEEGDLRIRQRPGAENALGFVKFLFPNRHNVYLHDTPHDNLFAKLTRDLSHGCVRVEQPTDLARFVLKDQPEWTPERIEAAMHAGKEEHVALKKKIPVHLAYFTIRVGKDGKARTFDDVYGYDARQAQLWDAAKAGAGP
jgi:murein L,D-transpeptidase YcbB/YkuD